MRTLQIPRSARNFIEGLDPYQSLLLLAVPLAIVEPLKLIAVFEDPCLSIPQRGEYRVRYRDAEEAVRSTISGGFAPARSNCVIAGQECFGFAIEGVTALLQVHQMGAAADDDDASDRR